MRMEGGREKRRKGEQGREGEREGKGRKKTKSTSPSAKTNLTVILSSK